MKLTRFAIALAILVIGLSELIAQDTIINIWNGKIPLNTGNIGEERITQNKRIQNVQIPQLLVFKANEALNTGVVIIGIPGGGYYHLVVADDFFELAQSFADKGITFVILKYRCPTVENIGHSPFAPLVDGFGAVEKTKEVAGQFQIDTNKIGVMGFSAGGHLAASMCTQTPNLVSGFYNFNATETKIPFAILSNAVISMQDGKTHPDNRNNLIGREPADSLVQIFSNELNVKDNMPEVLMFHAIDDPLCDFNVNYEFFHKMIEAGNTPEIHLFNKGGHGLETDEGKIDVLSYSLDWLYRIGMIESK